MPQSRGIDFEGPSCGKQDKDGHLYSELALYNVRRAALVQLQVKPDRSSAKMNDKNRKKVGLHSGDDACVRKRVGREEMQAREDRARECGPANR